MNYQKEIKRIIKQIVKGYKPEKIILFGNFAYGKPKENSDVDLVVIKKIRERPTKRILEIVKFIKSPLGTDILVYNSREWQEAQAEENYFIKEISEKGKLVYAE